MTPIIIPLIAFVLWASYPWMSREESLVKDARSLVFSGRVDSVYNDEANHNIQSYKLSNGHTYIRYNKSEIEILKGDSLSKSVNSTFVNIIKRDGSKIKADYKDLMLALQM